MKTSLLFATAVLLVSSWAFAQSAEERLTSDLMATAKKMPRAASLYHYFNAPLDPSGRALHPYLDNKADRDKWVQALVSSHAGTFWDLNFNSTAYVNAGGGMYLALDPSSSKEFGNSAVVLTAPEGASYLTVFKAQPIKKETVAALVNEGFVDRAQTAPGANTLGLSSGFSRYTLKNMLRPENLKFRQLVQKIFNANDIQWIEYEYKSYLAGFCKVSSQSAFIFIGQAPENLTSPAQAKVDSYYYGRTLLYSDLGPSGLSSDEEQRTSMVKRFRDVLDQIRIKGTGAAKKLMSEKLSEPEINQLVNESYMCVRR